MSKFYRTVLMIKEDFDRLLKIAGFNKDIREKIFEIEKYEQKNK